MSIFSESMSSTEARLALFAACDTHSKAEMVGIKEDYLNIISRILDHEIAENKGFMTSDALR